MTKVEVTQEDLRRRKRIHKITGYVDTDFGLAKELALHRQAAYEKGLKDAQDLNGREVWVW